MGSLIFYEYAPLETFALAYFIDNQYIVECDMKVKGIDTKSIVDR